jgi:hypothetical protein
METLVLKRTTPMDVLFSFVGAGEQVRIKKESDTVTISPIIDPADYEDDTAYLCAVPGQKEKLIASHNAPASEFSPMPNDWINRNV